MLVHRDFTSSSSRASRIHLLLLFAPVVMVGSGKVAVQAFPIGQPGGSPREPAGKSSLVGRPNPPTGKHEEIAQSEQIVVGYIHIYNEHVSDIMSDPLGKLKWDSETAPLFIYPRPLYGLSKWDGPEVLATVPQSFREANDFRLSLKPGNQPSRLPSDSKEWREQIVVSYGYPDFLLSWGLDKLDWLRICDCVSEFEVIKHVDHWQIPEWETLFPVLKKNLPDAKMAKLHSARFVSLAMASSTLNIFRQTRPETAFDDDT
ncbi:hypothetical protein F5880DRAFT_1509301 [Lentinula raphanica]|nr:hypothetical protein F5880DRAFT_1509301 [Lentinula raphanica]